jgi:hypothetical protein
MSLFGKLLGRDADVTARQARCALCGERFPAGSLRAHIDTENDEARRYVMKVIKSKHPDWVESSGACQKCWEYYKQLP